VWVPDGRLGGDACPAGQLQPPTSHPPTVPTTRRASATREPRMAGLLVSSCDALLSQDLAQPGMLVVHESLPSCASDDLVE
jgi:hypothetical protein